MPRNVHFYLDQSEHIISKSIGSSISGQMNHPELDVIRCHSDERADSISIIDAHFLRRRSTVIKFFFRDQNCLLKFIFHHSGNPRTSERFEPGHRREDPAQSGRGEIAAGRQPPHVTHHEANQGVLQVTSPVPLHFRPVLVD